MLTVARGITPGSWTSHPQSYEKSKPLYLCIPRLWMFCDSNIEWTQADWEGGKQGTAVLWLELSVQKMAKASRRTDQKRAGSSGSLVREVFVL